jgi:Bacterial Ig-like domain
VIHLLVWSVSFSGCIWPTDKPYLAAQDPPPLELVSTAPEPGDEGVEQNGVVVFTFDAPVHPDAVSRETVWVTAGTQDVASARRVSLLDCSVTLRPHAPLLSLLSHRAEVAGVYGFSAGPLTEPHVVVFTTGDGTVVEPPPTPPSLQAVFSAVLGSRCAGCHSGALPPAGLDLGTVDGAAAGLISRPSSLRSGSTLVVPGRHASSYLMWKLLALPSIFGDPMPPQGDWPTDRGCVNSDADLRLIADWIDGL